MTHRLSKLSWYRHRMAAMPAGELLWRAARALREPARRLGATRHRDFTPRFTFPGDPEARAREAIAAAARLLIPDPDAARRRHAERFPGGRGRAGRDAERALAHRIDLFARADVDLGPEIDWHRDYLTGGRWPVRYAGSIGVRDGERIGEVRTVWELNRHRHFVTLAKAAFLTGDARFAGEAVRQWSAWIDANPRLAGVNWSSPLEIAIRIVNWSWTLAFLRSTPAAGPVLEKASLARIIGAYQGHAGEIASNLSRYSSANNHLIGEAAGLALAGSLFPGLQGAARWRATGLRILEREAHRQIEDDGVGKEQASHYLAFVIDFYAAVAAVTARTGEPFPSRETAERIGCAAEFLAYLRNESNELPAIGDSDEGRAAGLFADGEDPFSAAIREGAALSGRGDLVGGVPLSEQAFWLLGDDAAREAPAPERPSRAFASGGYAVFRAGGARTTELEIVGVFDAGELGYLSLSAHGHADALSLVVSVAGRWLLADPGTYCYHRSWTWRKFFKGTAAHNTLVIDRKDQSEIHGPSLWGRSAQARLTHWAEGDGFWSAEGEHDGYSTLREPVVHRRQVVFAAPDLLLVIDRLDGRGEHDVAAHFQAGAGVTVAEAEGAVLFRAAGASALRLRAAGPWTPQIISGRESPPLGWISPRFGARVAAPAVEFAARVRVPCTLAFLLSVGASAAADGAEAEHVMVAAGGGVAARAHGRTLDVSPDGGVTLTVESAVP